MVDLHIANIVVHVVFGTLAIVLGLGQLFTKKGGTAHRWVGFAFLICFAFVIVTAIIGLTLFEFRAFLSVIVLVSGYQAVSGIRAARRRGARPTGLDQTLSLAALSAAFAFVVYIENVDLPWDRTVIYSTLAWLIMIAFYDLMRALFTDNWNRTTWPYEHLVKMLGAFAALLSAFAGTVLPQAQPLSQLLPSIFGVLLILYFSYRLARSPSPEEIG